MLRSAASFLLCSAVLSLPACAATLDSFSFTGQDSSSKPYSINFQLDPSGYTNNFGVFSYSNVPGTVDGVHDTFSLNIRPYTGSDSVLISDTGSLFQFLNIDASNGTDFLAGDPSSGNPPVVTLGSYTGTNFTECTASLTMPQIGKLPASLAMFQMSVPTLSVNCNAAIALNITGNSPAAVTPEPSTLALFATGALGIAGVLRRRVLS